MDCVFCDLLFMLDLYRWYFLHISEGFIVMVAVILEDIGRFLYWLLVNNYSKMS